MKNPTTLCENYFYHIKKLMCLLFRDLLQTNKKKGTNSMGTKWTVTSQNKKYGELIKHSKCSTSLLAKGWGLK